MLKPKSCFLSFVSLGMAPALNRVKFGTSAHTAANPAYYPTLRFNLLLNDLSKAGRLEDARRLFDEIPHKDEYSWNTMIAAYAHSGRLDESRELFDETPYRGLVAWSSLVSGCCRNGRDDEGFRLFWELQSEGQRPSEFTIGSVLRSCAARGFVGRGEEIHGYTIKTCFDGNIFVVTGLVDMYAKCGRVPEAECLFESVARKSCNHVLWSAMISGYMRNGDGDGAMRCFRDMTRHGIEPNQYTFPCVLSACADASATGFGVQVHCCILKSSLGRNAFVQSALVNMYVKRGDMNSATALIETMEIKDVVSWNSMIVGSDSQGFDYEALALFRKMHSLGTKMDDFTYPSVLKSSACVMDLRNSRSVHCNILKNGFDAYRLVSNALVDMYSKQGDLASAREIFMHMSDRDVISWTSLVTGYAHNGFYEEAIRLFCEMKIARVHPDDIVVASILSSAAELTLLEFGQQVHGTVYKSVYGTSTSVVNALVSLYAKCGCLEEASRIFDSMQWRDVITWTALIVGYAQNGKARNSVELYKQMVSSHIEPDYVTFIGLLFACSHAGLAEEGENHFRSMTAVYQIKPGPEHYACMIDLLGRSGKLAEAKELLNRMDVEPDATVWKALLSACRAHQDRELAERAAENLFRLEPMNSVPYVLLANIYFGAGEFEDAARIRKLMKSKGISKEPGCSWITINGRVHTFVSEDRYHPKTSEIYAKIQEMMRSIKKAGYVPNMDYALHDTDREEKELGLAYHSEKLAVAFGLLYASPGMPIRVFKNLRICGDCHAAMRHISKVYSRHIILRDSNCFHHFREGVCSCGDYW